MKAFIGIFVLLLSLPVAARDSVFGLWKTIDEKTGEIRSVVEIYEQDDKLFGKIAKIFPANDAPPNPVCEKCQDHRKDQPILGLTIIENLQQNGNEWEDGTVLDPDNGETYDCKIWLEDGKLRLRGYSGFLYRTQTWEPYEANEVSAVSSAD